LPELLRIGRETAEGLAAAHARGLVHRDVKPANIWLEGEQAEVKVLDFGLARRQADVGLTQPGLVVGTLAYMAPEQACGTAVDHRCDLFSLGVVLYRMCTGRLPFRGDTPLETLNALANETPVAPHRVDGTVPLPLSEFVMQLLDKNPAKRPASA